MKKVRQNLYQLSTIDGSLCAMMIGLGETFFPALLITLTGSSIQSGLVTTLPLFLASFLQILFFESRKYFAKQRHFVCLFTTLQGLSLLALGIALKITQPTPTFIFAIATLYWAFGQAAGPAWNMWLSDLVPEKNRLSFFSSREKWCHLATTIALIGGGVFLQLSNKKNYNAFALLFIFAALLRFASSYLLFIHPDNPSDNHKDQNLSLFKKKKTKDFFRWVMRYKHIFAFLFFIKTSVYFSASYFSPYMLKHLKLSYLSYTLLLTFGLVSRVGIMHLTSDIAKKIGIKYLLLFSTIGLAICPVFWTYTQSYTILILLQLLSGASWACFDFSVLIYLMNTIEHGARSKILVGLNFFYAAAALMGSSLGASMLNNYGENLASYHNIFETSSLLRLSCLIFVPAFFRYKVQVIKIVTRISALRPALGATIKPILFPRSKALTSIQKNRLQISITSETQELTSTVEQSKNYIRQ